MYAWSVISNNAVRNLSVVLSLCAVLVACARPDAAWEEARRLDTPDGYASYQERHPRSPHATEARVRREALLAERDWSVARNADTVEAYGEYLEKHPEGLWAGRAKERIASIAQPQVIENDAADPAAPTSPEPSTTTTPAIETPEKLSDSPVATVPEIYVQLGAFSTAEGAKKAWRELQVKHASLRGLQPVYRRSGSGAGGLHLLKAGVTTRASAEALCRELQAAGQACLIS